MRPGRLAGPAASIAVRAAGALCQLATGVLLTRVAGLEEAGVFFVYFAAVQIASVFAVGGYEQVLVSRVSAHHRAGRAMEAAAVHAHVARASGRIGFGVTAALALLGAVAARFHEGITPTLVGCVAASTFALGRTKIQAAWLRGIRRTNLSQWLNPLLPALGLLVLMLASGLRSAQAIAVASTASFAIAALVGAHLVPRGRAGPVPDSFRAGPWENPQLFVAELCTLCFVWLPTLALPALSTRGVVASAAFSIASRATRPLQLVRGAVAHWAGPRVGGVSGVIEEPERVAVFARNVAALNSIACLVLAVPLVVFAAPIVSIGFGVDSPDAAGALRVLAVMPLLNSLSGPTDLLLAMTGRSAKLAIAAGASLCVLATALALFHDTATMAAWVVLGASLCRDAISLGFVRRELGFWVYPRIG